MMEDYVVLGRVGEGAHGIVMKGRHKESGKTVALKKIPLKRIEDGVGEATIREIKALQQLESVHVVRYLYYITTFYHILIKIFPGSTMFSHKVLGSSWYSSSWCPTCPK